LSETLPCWPGFHPRVHSPGAKGDATTQRVLRERREASLVRRWRGTSYHPFKGSNEGCRKGFCYFPPFFLPLFIACRGVARRSWQGRGPPHWRFPGHHHKGVKLAYPRPCELHGQSLPEHSHCCRAGRGQQGCGAAIKHCLHHRFPAPCRPPQVSRTKGENSTPILSHAPLCS